MLMDQILYNVVQVRMRPNRRQASKMTQFTDISDAIREWFTECLIDGIYNLDHTKGKLPLKQALSDCCSMQATQPLPKIYISCILSAFGHAWLDSGHDTEYLEILRDMQKGRLVMPYKGQKLLNGGNSIYIAGLGRVRMDELPVTVINRIECYKSAKDWLADIRINQD